MRPEDYFGKYLKYTSIMDEVYLYKVLGTNKDCSMLLVEGVLTGDLKQGYFAIDYVEGPHWTLLSEEEGLLTILAEV